MGEEYDTNRLISEIEQSLDDWADSDMGLSNEPQWLRHMIWLEHDRIEKECFQ